MCGEGLGCDVDRVDKVDSVDKVDGCFFDVSQLNDRHQGIVISGATC